MFQIKGYRNNWAHNYSFTLRETYRVVDTIQVYLEEIQAPTDDINMIRLQVLDSLFGEEKEKLHRMGDTEAEFVNDKNVEHHNEPIPQEEDGGSVKRNRVTTRNSNDMSFSGEVRNLNEPCRVNISDPFGKSDKLDPDNYDSFCSAMTGISLNSMTPKKSKRVDTMILPQDSEDGDFTASFV
mmetsp:Transcript_12770/g.14368  ORF Transcript_12770/g.14368 Transcript_12770/m.14368 type:complete len:182 (+) Transcript_12770:195-740(+)